MPTSYDVIHRRYSAKIDLIHLLKPSSIAIDARVLECLLHSGVSTNERFTSDGKNLLHLAAAIRHEKTSLLALRIILQHSSNPNFPDREGNTSLHVAASLGHQRAIRLLICNGGDLLQCTLRGETSVDVAHKNGHRRLVAFLSKFLNSENHASQKEMFKKILWNRQILEQRSDLRHGSFLMATCGLCNENYFREKCSSVSDLFSNSHAENLNGTTILNSDRFRSSVCSILGNEMENQESFNFRRHLNECYQLGKQKDDKSMGDETFPDFLKRSLQSIRLSLKMEISPTKIQLHTENPSLEIKGSSFCETSPSYRTALSSLITTGSTYLTVVEEYLYQEEEKDVELVETTFLSSIYSQNLENRSTVNSDKEKAINVSGKRKRSIEEVSSLTESIMGLGGKELRTKLKELGCNAGPVTHSTFKVLQRHLHKMRMRPMLLNREEKDAVYPKELENIIANPNFDTSSAEEIEKKMCELFSSNETYRWRNGTQKTCFNYLLIDPRVANNLPSRKSLLSSSELLRTFLASIFYIGKGSRCRPYSHFYQALSTAKCSKNEDKSKKIQDIWKEGRGVVSLHIFQNVIPVEAWTREAAMIAAIGVKNLTNNIRGSFYGPASTWNKTDQRQMGSYFLFKALNILLSEGERQIKPRDLPSTEWIKKNSLNIA